MKKRFLAIFGVAIAFCSITVYGQQLGAIPVNSAVDDSTYFVGTKNTAGVFTTWRWHAPKGTVRAVRAGTGLSGGTVNDTGAIYMPNVGTANTYGDATHIPRFTTDAQGRVSAVTTVSITPTDTSRFQHYSDTSTWDETRAHAASTYHRQGGNSWGDTGRIGTNDNYPFAIRTNGANHYIIGSTGIGYMIGGNTSAGIGGTVLDLANMDGSGVVQSNHLKLFVGRAADGLPNVPGVQFGSGGIISLNGISGYSSMMLNNSNTSAVVLKGSIGTSAGGVGLIISNVNYTAGPPITASTGDYTFVSIGDPNSGNNHISPTTGSVDIGGIQPAFNIDESGTASGVRFGYADKRVTITSLTGKYAGVYLTKNAATNVYGVYQSGTAANLFTGSTTFSAGLKIGNGSFTSTLTTAATANRSVGLKDGDGTLAFTNDSTVFATTYGRDTASRNTRTYAQSTFVPLTAIGGGAATLLSGTVTVTDAACTPSSVVVVTMKSNSGTISFQYKVVPGSGSFVITGLTNLSATQTLDNSILQYFIKY